MFLALWYCCGCFINFLSVGVAFAKTLSTESVREENERHKREEAVFDQFVT